MTINLRGGATIRNGQLIGPGTPGHKPNTAPQGFARIGKAKNFQIADRDHGCSAHDVEIGVLGASHGKSHIPDASMGHGVPVHPGMMFKEGGQLKAGISRTQAMSPTDDEPNSKLLLHKDVPVDHPAPTHYHQAPGGIAGLSGSLPDKIIRK